MDWFVFPDYGGWKAAQVARETTSRFYYGEVTKARRRSGRDTQAFVDKSKVIARDLTAEKAAEIIKAYEEAAATMQATEAVYSAACDAAKSTRNAAVFRICGAEVPRYA